MRLGRREVVRFEGKAPSTAMAGARRCGIPDAGQPTTMGRAGAARVTVTRDGETLWRLIVVRPAASSGENGSAVELRGVSYRGKRVLRRAHVPILNVRYDDNACGPYRDWQNEESRFKAQGAAVAPGFRLCPEPAKTVLDSGDDQGNFAGVAIYVDDEEVVLVSELAAGWYRYVSRWRLHADGTIRARFGFGAVDNSCVCQIHHHHAYWRLDFDIAGAGEDVVLEHNDPPLPGNDSNWHTLRHEVRRRRNPGRKRRWRVRTQGSNEGYVIVPGAHDGEADNYGVGDFWALRYRPGQIDDGAVATSTRANLDAFVNGESIVGTNVVVWYAGHFSHEPERRPRTTTTTRAAATSWDRPCARTAGSGGGRRPWWSGRAPGPLVGDPGAGADQAAAGTTAGAVLRLRAAERNSRASPVSAQKASTATWPPAAAPSNRPVLRTRLPPAPGGSSWPIEPAAVGSISGPVATPENGLPISTMVSAASAAPALPSSVSSPATRAAMASTVRLSAPALTSQSPPIDVEPALDDRGRRQAGGDRAADDQAGALQGAGAERRRGQAGDDAGEHERQHAGGEAGGGRAWRRRRPRRAPSPRAAAWLSSWATAGLAAVAVRTLGPAGVATKAP